MIWVGRIFSLPVGLVFFVLLLVSLVLLQVSDSFLDPDFYTNELRKADIYEFVLVDLLTSALDEAKEHDPDEMPGGFEENPLVTSGLSTQEIVSSVNKAVPPEWVQGLVEQSFDQFGRYITGERGLFEVTVRAGEQVPILVEETKSLLRKADAYNLLYDEVVTPAVEESADMELPLGIEVSTSRLVEAARRVVPAEWVQAEVEDALDEITPYAIGERDTFEITVQISDRVGIALDEIKQLLREADAYELLYTEVVEPRALDNLGETVELPFGVTVTGEEVIAALRRVAPAEWVQEQAETLIDEVGPYMTGEVNSFAIEVSLEDNKRQARTELIEFVDSRLTELVDSLPSCASADELRSALSLRESGELPRCIPPDILTGEVRDRYNIDIGENIQQHLLGPIPDTITFTDTQLRQALVQAGAGENIDRLDDLREILRDGWHYSETDLRADLLEHSGEAAVERLDDIRMFLTDGWTYTNVDFRQDVSEQSDGDTLEAIDNARSMLDLARTFRWVVFLPLLLILVSIGFMGGRGWAGRVSWAAAFLMVSAGLIYLVFGLGYDTYAKSGIVYGSFDRSDIEEVREEALSEISQDSDFPNTMRLAANKVFDMGESVADDFAGGIASISRILAIIGLLAFVIGVFWSAIKKLGARHLPDIRSSIMGSDER